MTRLWRCAFEGCLKTSEQRILDGWVNFDLDNEHPGLTGWYCLEHGRAPNAVLVADEDEDDEDEED